MTRPATIPNPRTLQSAPWILLCVLISGLAGAAPVVPTLRGPTGFAANPSWRGPDVELRRASVRVELHPDLAVLEHTYTLHNPGEPVQVTVGLRHRATDESDAPGTMPLAATGWLDGSRLSNDQVRLQGVLADDNGGPGWELPIQCRLPKGDAILSVIVVTPTVPLGRSGRGVSRPLSNASEITLESSYSAWDWSLRENLPAPELATAMTLSADVPLDEVEALRWMPEAVRKRDTTYWKRAPDLVLRYDSAPGAPRITTRDGLRRAANELAQRSVRGHIDIPASAVPVDAPGRAMGEQPIDPARTRRAMLVPASVLLLILAVAYILRRRWEKRL